MTGAPGMGTRRIKALPIISYAQSHLVLRVIEFDADLFTGAMLRRIRYRLLADAQQVIFHLARQAAGRTVSDDLNFHGGASDHLGGDFGNRRRQVAVLQRQGAQVPNRAARLRLAASDHALNDLEGLPSQLWRVGPLRSDRVQLDCDARELLFEGVVEFPCDAGAFLQRGLAMQALTDDLSLLGHPSPEHQHPPK